METLGQRLDAAFAELLPPPAFLTSQYGNVYGEGGVETMTAWLLSAANLIGVATSRRGVHWDQAQSLVTETLKPNLSARVIKRMEGVLRAADEDRKRGLLGDVQYAIYAETFDDFLDIAADLHKESQLNASAVLASAVLEDTFKKIAEKNDVDPDPSLEQVINELASKEVLTRIEAKRAKVCADVRTSAPSTHDGTN